MATETVNKNNIGVIGVCLGVLSLGMALFHFWYGPIDKHLTLEDAVAEQALSLKDRVISKIKGDTTTQYAPKRKFNKDEIFDFVIVGFAFAAIVFAVISFVKREEKRACIAATLLGFGAITFKFLTIALGAIVFVILVAVVLNSVGLS
jgi:hypothetical protein